MLITINNCLASAPRAPERLPERIKAKLIHRISFAADDGGIYWNDVTPIPDDELTGPLVAQKFLDTRRVDPSGKHWGDRPGRYTGGCSPYQFLERTSGVFDQLSEVGETTAHASVWNIKALGIAVVGDFRKHQPTPAQMDALIPFSALWISYGLDLYGHTEAPGASSDPGKECPGDMLSMELLRCEAMAHPWSQLSEFEAEKRLIDLGVTF